MEKSYLARIMIQYIIHRDAARVQQHRSLYWPCEQPAYAVRQPYAALRLVWQHACRLRQACTTTTLASLLCPATCPVSSGLAHLRHHSTLQRPRSGLPWRTCAVKPHARPSAPALPGITPCCLARARAASRSTPAKRFMSDARLSPLQNAPCFSCPGRGVLAED